MAMLNNQMVNWIWIIPKWFRHLWRTLATLRYSSGPTVCITSKMLRKKICHTMFHLWNISILVHLWFQLDSIHRPDKNFVVVLTLNSNRCFGMQCWMNLDVWTIHVLLQWISIQSSSWTTWNVNCQGPVVQSVKWWGYDVVMMSFKLASSPDSLYSCSSWTQLAYLRWIIRQEIWI